MKVSEIGEKQLIERIIEKSRSCSIFNPTDFNDFDIKTSIGDDSALTSINIDENSKFYEAAQFHALQIYDRLQYRSQAVELGKKLVKQFPRSKYNSEAYRILGENSYFQQNWHDAVEFLKLYAKNQKQVQRADMYMLGIANYMVANYPDAITYLGKVTTEQDSLAQNAYIFIGHANLQQHQADMATKTSK